MAAETGFTIQGAIYEPPTVDSLNNDENQVLFDCTGFSQEDFFRRADESKEDHDDRLLQIVRHPGFDTAWMRIAFQRGNPHLSRQKVAQIVGATNRLEALATLGDDQVEEREDEVPLASTSEPAGSSPTSSLESTPSPKQESEKRGNGSTNGSETLAATPPATGALRSATPAISPQEISAA